MNGVNTNVMLDNLAQILPMVVVVVGALVTMLMSVARSHKDPEHTQIAPQAFVVISLVTLGVALAVLMNMEPQKATIWSGTLAIDRLALAGQGLLLVISAIALCIGTAEIQTQGMIRGEYYSLTLFAVVGMMLMVSASELLTFFVGLEIMSLAVYVLVGFRRADRWSQEAAFKYFMSGAFASAFFLFGAGLLFGATGTTEYAGIAESVAKVLGGASFPMSTLLLVGSTLCIIGFLFKIAAVPFHMWAPDVYQGAPTMVTGFMAVTVKAAAFVAFARFVLVGLSSGSSHMPELSPLFEVLAILTMTIGNLSAVLQRNVKRMLAYSSIAHAGYLLVGLIATLDKGDKGDIALQGMLFYLFTYTLATLGAFGVLVALERRGARHDESLLNRYAGVAWKYPGLAIAFGVFMFALSGIPPTAGFVGKVALFAPALDGGHVALVLIAVINSVISVYYYLRVVVYMFMKNPVPRKDQELLGSSPWLTGALTVTTLLVLAVGVMPEGWLQTFAHLL